MLTLSQLLRPCKQRNYFLNFFLIFFSLLFPLFDPTATPTKLSAHTVAMYHWLSQPDVTLHKVVILGGERLRGDFGGFPVLEFPRRISPFIYFALAVPQLSFLQVNALVPSCHKNTCGSLQTVRKLSLEPLSPAVSLFKHSP